MSLSTMNGTIIPDDLKGIPKFRIYKNTSCEDYPLHWHTGVEIVLPLENSYQVVNGNQVYELQPNDLCFINSGALHRLIAPKTPGTRIFMQFDLTLLYNLNEFDTMINLLPPVLVMSPATHKEAHQKCYDFAKEIIREYNDNAILREATIYSYFIQIYLILLKHEIYQRKSDETHTTVRRKNNEHVRKLLDICRYINEHFTQDISLTDVANHFGFSKYHFTRLFKEFTHTTFHQYLNNLRIEHAEALLANFELSVIDVALMSGFSSISTFNRVFKDQKMISPTNYRKSYLSVSNHSLDDRYTDSFQ